MTLFIQLVYKNLSIGEILISVFLFFIIYQIVPFEGKSTENKDYPL